MVYSGMRLLIFSKVHKIKGFNFITRKSGNEKGVFFIFAARDRQATSTSLETQGFLFCNVNHEYDAKLILN
jgi:hypothetical protein